MSWTATWLLLLLPMVPYIVTRAQRPLQWHRSRCGGRFFRFLTVNAQVSGYTATIQNNGPALFELLAPHYYVFVDAEEWCRMAKEVLLEVGKGSTAIKVRTRLTLCSCRGLCRYARVPFCCRIARLNARTHKPHNDTLCSTRPTQC